MLTKPRPWTLPLRRALTSPGNLIVGAGAVLASAVTWNPLPLILYGLGAPVWLYGRTTSRRYARQLRADQQAEAREASRRTLSGHEHKLAWLIGATPAGQWIRRGQLPDYAAGFRRLVAMRDQAEGVVANRHDTVNALEQDVVARMDDLLRAYLTMASERLLFHCALAKIYPQVPALPVAEPAPPTLLDRIKRALITADEPDSAPPVPTAGREDTRFVSVDNADCEVRNKLADLARDAARDASRDEVYRPIIEMLERRLGELAVRKGHDLAMAAQLEVLPDQMEIILNKLATTQADVSEVIADVKLLVEQVDDTVRFAEDVRGAERQPLATN